MRHGAGRRGSNPGIVALALWVVERQLIVVYLYLNVNNSLFFFLNSEFVRN